MTKLVGPVLEANELGRAVAAAILRSNPEAVIIDRGAYLRVSCPGVCVLERAAVEAIIGAALTLPIDLEQVMPAFSGLIELDADRVRWLDRLEGAR